MGETDDPPSLLDRIHSGAKTTAFGRTTSKNTLPTYASQNSGSSTYPPVKHALHGVPGTAPHGPTAPPTSSDPEKPPFNEKYGAKSHQDSTSSSNITPDNRSTALPPPAPPPDNTKEEGSQSAAITSEAKPSWPQRAKAGSLRFLQHTKDAIFHTWLNVLLIFVPIGIAVEYAPLPESSHATVVFAINAVAIIPLAGMLALATESVAGRMGDTWASLLNVTFGNAVELIIFIIALSKNQIPIVQASILGSILANLLLILGMAFLLGGLRYREQIYNSTVTQMSAVLLCLAVTSLLLPTAFHASFSNYTNADDKTIKISRGTSVVLLLVYALYLLFQLKSHAYMYESTPQAVIDEEAHPGVLAGMMDSSSDSSSSSSSDSDSSLGSHITSRKRIKRAFKNRMRRKSNASSTVNSSTAVSSPSSPSNEGASVHDSGTPASVGYFRRHRRDTNTSAGVSDNEADTDGETGSTAPRVRDFQDENDGKSRRQSFFTKSRKHKKHHKKEKKDRKSKHPSTQESPEEPSITESPFEYRDEATEVPAIARANANSPHVGFVNEKDGQPNDQDTGKNLTTSPRRPFPLSRQSFKPPPLSNVFANTVFTTPAPAPTATTQPGALSVARSVPLLRRTNSLPDRLNSQNSKAPVAPANTSSAQGHDAVLNGPDAARKDHEEDGKPAMSRTAAVMLLLISTGLVALCAEFLVSAIPEMIESTNVSEAFIGLIILPIVGNAAEHVTAVIVATKNKMDLAIGIALGSSIQIALFITPIVVLLGWILDKDMSLLFTLFETISLFVTVFVVNFLVLDGRSNYLEGSLLISAYVIIAVAAFYYPSTDEQSVIGGGPNDGPEVAAAMLRFFRG